MCQGISWGAMKIAMPISTNWCRVNPTKSLTPMNPDEYWRMFNSVRGDVDAAVKTNYSYLAIHNLRRLLGFESRLQVHGFLKDHQVYLNYSEQDLEHDLETARDFGAQWSSPTLRP